MTSGAGLVADHMELRMARPDDRTAREQAIPEHQAPKPDQVDRRLRESMEDDEAREALKSLHALQDRRAQTPSKA
jgi:hypothetical protein